MRLVVDANPLFPLGPGLGPTGVGRWAAGTLQALSRAAPDWQIDLVAFHMSGNVEIDSARFGSNVNFKIGRFPNRVYRKLRGLNALPPVEWILGPLDAMLGPAYVTWRCSRAAEIPVVHDLSFVHYPKSVSWQNLYFLRWNVPHVIKRAARVVTVSEASRSDIDEHFPSARGKISVVPNGCDLSRFGSTMTPISLPAEYLLFVGTREPRKNLLAVLAAHELLGRSMPQPLPLVVVGGPGWRGKELEAELDRRVPGGGIHVLGYVPDDELAAIYSGATALVFPSLYEGFGLPIIEAMAAGCPVITSDRGAMAEVAGGAAVLVSPEDPAAIAAAMEKIVFNADLAARLTSLGRERAAEFSWDAAGTALKAVVEEAVDRKRHSR